MAVEKRLHHVFRRDRLPRDFLAIHRGAAFQHELERLALQRRRHREGDAHLVAPCRDSSARKDNAARRILEGQCDGTRESIPAQRVHREGNAGIGDRVDARRRYAQFEIGPRRADAQAVGVLRAAFLLGVADVEE